MLRKVGVSWGYCTWQVTVPSVGSVMDMINVWRLRHIAKLFAILPYESERVSTDPLGDDGNGGLDDDS
jgi:hypothetical protein